MIGWLVQQSVEQLQSFQSQWNRFTGTALSANAFRQLEGERIEAAFADPSVRIGALTRLQAWKALRAQAEFLERWVLDLLPDRPGLCLLKSAPGIGKILGMTVLMETGPIERFGGVGDYASYCRMVGSQHLSNGKKKGEGNRKCGNRYLCWAYIEAAHYAQRHEAVRAWYQRKRARSNMILARKAVAHKIARGCYHVLRNRQPFDLARAFG